MQTESHQTKVVKLGLTHKLDRVAPGSTASTHAFDTSRHRQAEAEGEWTNLRQEIALEIQNVDSATGVIGATVLSSSRKDLSQDQPLTFAPIVGEPNTWRCREIPLLTMALLDDGSLTVGER